MREVGLAQGAGALTLTRLANFTFVCESLNSDIIIHFREYILSAVDSILIQSESLDESPATLMTAMTASAS